jgi:hypothetical protein
MSSHTSENGITQQKAWEFMGTDQAKICAMEISAQIGSGFKA